MQEVSDRGRSANPAGDSACGKSRNEQDWMSSARSIVFIAWRDLANTEAGGSEILVDRLAQGLTARGDRVSLLCGGEVAERRYEGRRSRGTHTPFPRPPFALRRALSDF